MAVPHLVLAGIDPGNINVDVGSFLVVVITGAIAGTISAVAAARKLLLPSVVLELVLGILVGPRVLGLGQPSGFLQFFADLGLGMLFFFAGYEIDIRRISGQPLRLAAFAWALSLLIAYTVGGVLASIGLVLSLLYTGSALATTAIGTYYRKVLDRRDRIALAFFTSTQLPLVLAITTVAVASGNVRASTAAALVSAAVLSTLIYPLLGLRMRGDAIAEPAPSPAP